MGLIQNEHGVWIVRRRVPSRLQEAVARVLEKGKERRAFLQKSLGTMDRKEATRLAPAVLVSFQKTLGEAEALLAERPVRTSLAQSEIERIADFHFAASLAADEEFTHEGGGDDELLRDIARQLDEGRIDYSMPIPLDAQRPAYGLRLCPGALSQRTGRRLVLSSSQSGSTSTQFATPFLRLR